MVTKLKWRKAKRWDKKEQWTACHAGKEYSVMKNSAGGCELVMLSPEIKFIGEYPSREKADELILNNGAA